VRGQVRNSAGGIVQLEYGDDGLDPVSMEAADGRPLDLPRSLSLVRATSARRAPPDLALQALPENAAQDGAPCAFFCFLVPVDWHSSTSYCLQSVPLGPCCWAVVRAVVT
jgi:hypothetical protein